ncbi:MAG: 1-(5-phosphoribosyl)-5-[(5-phosphoribosylamino)methylideneamino]imidazole-4-carboxamide isomerase [Chloroflexi bacterium]|nr:1-(5-phosphoribosyl)-5-[(5-phosphoribosylamino)methylideneamino]imidazole-4-carboxamide isomerase [Chloroflexota bacterium]
MEVIPAIDIKDGKCVRLYQGDYGRQTVYSENPVEVAARWADMGATRLHVVDLDGARDGASANLPVIEKIFASVDVPVQLGGGIRTLEIARNALSIGVSRVLVGTAAVEQPELIREMCDALGPEVVVVTLDARDGYVAVKGWTQRSQVRATELVMQMAELGVRRFLYTDIARDGTLTEPNFEAIGALIERVRLPVIAAGGVSSVEHILRLRQLGAEGAIAGKALYTGDLDLREALEAARQTNLERIQ